MKRQRLHMLAAGLLASTLCLAGVCRSADKQASQREASAADETNESVSVRYARAYLKLAEMRLRNILEVNQRVAGTYSAAALERLRQAVGIAEERLQHTLHPDQANPHRTNLRNTEAAVKVAEVRLQKAVATNRQSPGTVGKLELERLRLVAEVARLGLAKTRDLGNANSAQAYLEWQLEQLREEVLHLEIRVDALRLH